MKMARNRDNSDWQPSVETGKTEMEVQRRTGMAEEKGQKKKQNLIYKNVNSNPIGYFWLNKEIKYIYI